MTSYNGKAITYNDNGGVASYDGWDYTWTKGKLSRIKKNMGNSSRAIIGPGLAPSKTYTFGYNGLGQRISQNYSYFFLGDSIIPVQQGEITAYNKSFSYDHLGRLIAENIDKTFYGVGTESSKIVYLYDESGIIGMQYTNSTTATTNTYYFLRNLQGDVIAIYDTTGNKVVEYSYDAWGNCTIESATTNYDLAHANPIRYRGYYYDEATKLYYLNARYYNPQWRRFISPDDTAYLDPESVNGLNLYAYCNNDPVNYADPSGYSAILITLGIMAIGGFIGAAVSAGTSALVQLAINGEVNLKSVGVAAISGFISGAIAASPLGLTGQMIAGGIIGGTSYIADCYVNDTAITLDGAILSIGMGVLSGRIGGPGANEKKVLTNSILQLKKTIARETRRANQKHAQKAIAAMTSYVYNILDASAFSSSVKFAAGCGVSSAVTTGYANYRLFQNWPSWKFWGE